MIILIMVERDQNDDTSNNDTPTYDMKDKYDMLIIHVKCQLIYMCINLLNIDTHV